MIVEIVESVRAEVIMGTNGTNLRATPRWFLSSGKVILGHHYSSQDWLAHSLKSVGSRDALHIAGYDEVLFDQCDLLLWGVLLHDSEVNVPAGILFPWINEQPVTGTIRLISADDFVLDVERVRWIAPDGSAFACLFDDVSYAQGDSLLRLNLADNFDLLFAHGRLCGWLLSHPAHYVVNSWAEPFPDVTDNATDELLHEYMILIEATNVRQLIWNKDPITFRLLANLHERLGYNSDTVPQLRIIRQYLEQIVEKFYGRLLP